MKYLLVNPYGEAYGVTSYCRNALNALAGKLEISCISNTEGLSFAAFRERVRDHVIENFDPGEVVIEAPEARAAALLVPPRYRLHIRLHGPNGLLHRYDSTPRDRFRIKAESEMIARADVLSAPSYAIVDHLGAIAADRRIHVYKNPPDRKIRCHRLEEKTYDAIFLAHTQVPEGVDRPLKGADHLASLLERLPAASSVALVGAGTKAFAVPPDVKCRVERFGLITGPERFRLLGRARVLLVLSRFENCSMAILESIAAGTVVVGWDRGGNAEIAPSPLLRLVPYGDVDALESLLWAVWKAPYPSRSEFRRSTSMLLHDFESGWERALQDIGSPVALPPYRGIDHRSMYPDVA